MSKVSLKGLIKSKHADIEEANEKKDLKDHGARYDVATLRLVVMPLITESLTNFYEKYKNVIKGRAKEIAEKFCLRGRGIFGFNRCFFKGLEP